MHVIYNKQTKKPETIGELAKGFLESKEEQFIASTVSAYSKKSPLEFVAEVYARMLKVKNSAMMIMNLYNNTRPFIAGIRLLIPQSFDRIEQRCLVCGIITE